jgi:hypothetical protein
MSTENIKRLSYKLILVLAISEDKPHDQSWISYLNLVKIWMDNFDV